MNTAKDFTSGRLLARNTLINLLSDAAPFTVAIFAVPVLIHRIGVERYGVLTLNMMAVGYLGVFDFGLGRAATKFIAEAAAAGETERIPELFWTALYLMSVFGCCAGIVVAAVASWLTRDVLKVPFTLWSESVRAIYVLAVSMPFVVSGGSLSGTLSAFQRFDLIALVRIPIGILSYLGPLLVLPFSHAVDAMVAAIALARILGWLATFALCVRVIPALGRRPRARLAVLRPMLSFGGWVTVSGVVGPIMVYFDRFFIGAMVSLAAVSYYTAPFQITSKLGVLPIAIGGVVFSAFSSSFARNPERAKLIFDRAARSTLVALFGPVVLIVTFAPELLSLWLGPAFSANSATVLRWFAAAAFVNCLGWTPYGLLQAAHRPDLPAKLHIAEAPFYLATLWWMVVYHGIEGAAIAYTLRVVADTCVLLLLASRVMPDAESATRRIAILASVAMAGIGVCAVPTNIASKCLVSSVILIGFSAAGWKVLLQREEKDFVRESVFPSLTAAIWSK